MVRSLLLSFLALAALTAPCASTAEGGVQPPATHRGRPGYAARAVTFTTSDGVRLTGVLAGGGGTGVVLIHDAGAIALCGWWPFAVRLARNSFHVLLFDMPCYGLSACPTRHGSDAVTDVAAAVATLRHRGAQTVQLVGASYGGSVALVAATRLRGIAALADLSGDELEQPIGGLGAPLSAERAALRLHVPFIAAVARDDPYLSVAQERALYRHCPASRKQLVVLPSGAGHGWDLLHTPAGTWSPFAARLTTYLKRHGAQ
jgi:dienelactone hydrolase